MFIRFGLSSFFAAAFLTLSSAGALAQNWAMNDAPEKSVYEASTVAAVKPVIKSLTAEEFSAYATEICKKYEFDGPKQVNSSTDQTELYQKLSEARKLLFTRLCDPEVRKDSVLKEKLQSQMKSLTEDIRSFPELAGFGKVVVPPTQKERIQALRQNADSEKQDVTSQPEKVFRQTTKKPDVIEDIPKGSNLPTKRNYGWCDSLPATRDQIKQKHGKYYVPLVPKK
jgi:hypothetical protein